MEKTELTNAQKQNRVRQRISQASIDPDKYEYIPAKEQNDHVKADQYQRVAIYARVSTDNPMQTTSFELQQKYYKVLGKMVQANGKALIAFDLTSSECFPKVVNRDGKKISSRQSIFAEQWSGKFGPTYSESRRSLEVKTFDN